MSCIKFPSSKTEVSKLTSKENVSDHTIINSQLIAIANQVFGEGNWSHGITNQTVDFIDYITGKYQAGCCSIVRVQLKDGTFHEDVGYSNTEGSTKGSAIQKARLSSFNSALKKALMCFGSEVTTKINRMSSRSNSPVPPESNPNKFLQIEASSSVVTNKMDTEPFEESIPMSQTDALMGTVDLDQIFVKDQNLNNDKNSSQEVKEEFIKSVSSTDKDKINNINTIRKELRTDVSKTNVSAVIVNVPDKNKKTITVNGFKKETKPEVSKTVTTTVMTEEEMRLERKRKQREMQEEFKRKEEYKRKHGEPGSKPNPRY